MIEGKDSAISAHCGGPRNINDLEATDSPTNPADTIIGVRQAFEHWARRQKLSQSARSAAACVASNLHLLERVDSRAVRCAVAQDLATIERDLAAPSGEARP